jgi:hypothetical protein
MRESGLDSQHHMARAFRWAMGPNSTRRREAGANNPPLTPYQPPHSGEINCRARERASHSQPHSPRRTFPILRISPFPSRQHESCGSWYLLGRDGIKRQHAWSTAGPANLHQSHCPLASPGAGPGRRILPAPSTTSHARAHVRAHGWGVLEPRRFAVWKRAVPGKGCRDGRTHSAGLARVLALDGCFEGLHWRTHAMMMSAQRLPSRER